MRLSTTLRAGSAALLLTLVGLTSACASGPADSGPSLDSDSGTSAESNEEVASEESSGDGDYAFGSDRDQVATAIESAFESQNGKVKWDGDTLVLSVDGDATKAMAGFQQCRVLGHLINEEDLSVIKFPNGEVSCEEVLAVM